MIFERRALAIIGRLLLAGDLARPVLIPANVCPVVPLAIRALGGHFRVVDISPATLCMDEALAMSAIGRGTERCSAVIFVRTYGANVEPDEFLAAVKRVDSSIVTIDDRCLCVPAGIRGGREADVELYSSGHGKYVGVGGGGWAFTRHAVPYSTAPLPFDPESSAQRERYYCDAVAARRPVEPVEGGWIDGRRPEATGELHVARVLDRLDVVRRHKARIDAIYRSIIPACALLPERFQNWRFNILVNRSQDLVRAIFAAGYFASTHYADVGPTFGLSPAPVATELHNSVVNLFNDLALSEDAALRTAEIVAAHVLRHGGSALTRHVA